MPMQLIPVPPDRIAALWLLIRPFAEQMAKRFPDDWPPAELRRRAESGLTLLWLVRPPDSAAPTGMVGTEIHAKPSGRRGLVIVCAAGSDHRRALAVMPELERYGASLGCDFIEIRGRSGWARHLQDYRVTPGVVLTKEYKHGQSELHSSTVSDRARRPATASADPAADAEPDFDPAGGGAALQ